MRAVLLLILLFVLGCATACKAPALRGAPTPGGDAARAARLSADVAYAFHAAGVPGWEEVRIVVEDDLVRLVGAASDAVDGEALRRIAAGVPGVASVRIEAREARR